MTHIVAAIVHADLGIIRVFTWAVGSRSHRSGQPTMVGEIVARSAFGHMLILDILILKEHWRHGTGSGVEDLARLTDDLVTC